MDEAVKSVAESIKKLVRMKYLFVNFTFSTCDDIRFSTHFLFTVVGLLVIAENSQ